MTLGSWLVLGVLVWLLVAMPAAVLIGHQLSRVADDYPVVDGDVS